MRKSLPFEIVVALSICLVIAVPAFGQKEITAKQAIQTDAPVLQQESESSQMHFQTQENRSEQNVVQVRKYNATTAMTGTQSYHTIQASNGTSGTSRAPQGSQRYIRTAYIISAAEMIAANFPSGDITSIGFSISTAQSVSTTGTFKVYLQNTSDATYLKPTTTWTNGSTGVIDGMTLAHDGSITIPATTGTYDVEFAGGSAFTWTGGGVYVAFEYQNPSPGTISGSNVVNCNTNIVNGLRNAFSTTSLPTSLANTSNFRPVTRFGSPFLDVIHVQQLYILGKLPIPFGTPTPISALIKNNGFSTLTSLDVHLTIKEAVSGTVRHTETVTVGSLASGATQIVSFTSWSPTIAETDSVIVDIDPQGGEVITFNNRLASPQVVNANSYSYAQGSTPTNGVGFNGSTGDFVARFTTNSPNSINQIDVNFFTGGQPFKIGIWDASGAGSTPGTNLFTSASQTSAVGVYTVLIDPPISVNGDFFVGVRQTGTVNVNFAYQTENPIRASTFYYASPTGGTTWTDFAPINPYRFMIEPKFALNNDVGPQGTPTGGALYYSSTTIDQSTSVANFGLNTNSFTVTRKISPGGYTSTRSVTSLAPSTSAPVTFDPWTFTNGNTYTVKDSTYLATDQNTANDVSSNSITPTLAQPTLVLWGDAPSRDSVIARLQATLTSYDVLASTYTGSYSAWRTIFFLLASNTNWTAVNRDSLKAWLDNAVGGQKRTLLIFGNDCGYNNDPIRNVAAPAADTVFFRQYLRAQYISDSWLTSVPAATNHFYGMGYFTAITGDSVNDPYPDMVKPVNGGTAAFLPLTKTTGDSANAVFYSGANYNVFYGTNVYANYKSNTIGIFDVLSGWATGNGGLPFSVELVSLTAAANNASAELHWSTATEVNNAGFEIERRVASGLHAITPLYPPSRGDRGVAWDKIGFVEGNGTTNVPKEYSFTDKDLSAGKYSYRLKQIDRDGKFKYSGEVEVAVGIAPMVFALSQNYPNPFNPATTIGFTIDVSGMTTLKVFDLLGKEVATVVHEELEAGVYYQKAFDASNLASGIYFARLQSGSNMQLKKMTVLK